MLPRPSPEEIQRVKALLARQGRGYQPTRARSLPAEWVQVRERLRAELAEAAQATAPRYPAANCGTYKADSLPGTQRVARNPSTEAS
jgi:hypothetical protein